MPTTYLDFEKPLAEIDKRLDTLRRLTAPSLEEQAELATLTEQCQQQERRKELICEGHRFFDLKRTTRLVSRANCASFCTLPPGNRAWTWPIPQPEIDANANILPQNPGY